jgi:two-component system, cell cycle sensor histidine kinase and response regulator CckA
VVKRVHFRIVFLTLIALCLFTCIFFFIDSSEHRKFDIFFKEWSSDKSNAFNRILELKGFQLNSFVADYSNWDEMVEFVKSADPRWAQLNLNSSLSTYHISAIWVYNVQKECIYSIASAQILSLDKIQIPPAAIDLADSLKMCHFHMKSSAGLLDFHGATIHPTTEKDRVTAPKGYLFACTIWDSAAIKDLSHLTECSLLFSDTMLHEKSIKHTGLHCFNVPLKDLSGDTLTFIHATTSPFALKEFRDFSKRQMTILLIISALSLLVLSMLLLRWIADPLRCIYHSLKTENPEPVRKLMASGTEFGMVAGLIVRSFDQRRTLMEEVAERRKTETALRRSEERYRILVETSPDAILLLELDRTIILCNRHSLHLVAYSNSDELHGRCLDELIDTTTREGQLIADFFKEVKNKDQVHTWEGTALRRNGTTFPAELTVSLVRNDAGEPNAFICIFRDITGRKRAELENMHLQEQFRAVYKMEAIGQLAGGVAHDFNNILGAISGYADIIRQKYSQDPKLDKYASMILSAATRAADLTSKLLTFSRRGKLQMTPFNVHQVLADIADILERTIEKNIRITLRTEAKNPIITGDAGQFQSAVMNLALNGRDAMPQGGELRIATTDVVLDENFAKTRAYVIAPGPYLMVIVEDTGTGMDKQAMAHLFEPFYTTKDIGKGTGLGLASVYGSVKSHNGYIDVISEPGKGSIFTMYYPSTTPTSKMTADQNHSNCIRGKGTILVVDDENFLRDALREMLSWLGYSVAVCGDGETAIQYYRQHHDHIDLIILDMVMPGLDGRSCFRLLKEINPHVKVLLATGYSLQEERQEMLDDGIVGILQKPFISAQLAKAVNEAFAAGT